MNRNIGYPLLLLSLLSLPMPANSQAENVSNPPSRPCVGSSAEDTSGVTPIRYGSGNIICVNWKVAAGRSSRRVRETRFTARAPVTVHTYQFNFLRFTIQYNVEEEAVESYQALEKLWGQFFIVGALPGGQAAASTGFNQAMFEWLDSLRVTNDSLQSYIGHWVTPGLSEKQVDSIAAQVPWAQSRMRLLDSLRAAARTALDAEPDPERDDYLFYESRLPTHDQVISRLRAFISAAGRTKTGERKVIQPSASGTIVTVSLVAKDENQVQTGGAVTLEYFVESRMPVVFHTGLSWTNLRDVEFEQIRTLNDQDLWTKTKDDETSTDLTAFLSYPIQQLTSRLDFGRLGSTDVALLPTVGTELSSPGKTIFVGVTLRAFRRMFLTGGLASGEVAEEGSPFLDRIGTELETRELFDAITRRRKWGPYISFSLGVID